MMGGNGLIARHLYRSIGNASNNYKWVAVAVSWDGYLELYGWLSGRMACVSGFNRRAIDERSNDGRSFRKD
jgi:hypothetical protein